MNKIKSAEDLEVFKKGHQLTIETYKITESFPQSEKFGLVSQMRRAAASMPANLIEGSQKLSRTEYRHFVSIAKGSAGELKYHFLLAKDLGYISASEYSTFRAEIDEISKMLNGLVKTLSK
jgi:four helix bundle protein